MQSTLTTPRGPAVQVPVMVAAELQDSLLVVMHDLHRLEGLLNHATDKRAINQVMSYGAGTPSPTFMPISTPLAYGDKEPYPYDIAKAKKLMADAGYASGFEVSCMALAGNVDDVAQLSAIQQMWSQIGVRLKIEQLESASRLARFRATDYQMRTSLWTNDINDPSQITSYFAYFPTIQSNRSGWQNKEVDALFEQSQSETDVPKRAAEKGYLVVTPEAIDGTWELGGTGADGDFLIGLLDDIEARYCVDQDRTHIMGVSLGAWKAAATACSFPGRFASAVLVTVEVFPGTCDPLPVMAFHGTADATVPYGPGADPGVTVVGSNKDLPGAESNIAKWAENGGCDPDPVLSEPADDIVLRRFEGCDPGIDVELSTVLGGGHTWPGADIEIAKPGLTTQSIDATDLAMAWFAAHPRRH